VENVQIVRGDVTDQTLLERTLGEYEIDTVLHLAAQTQVLVANRNPVSTFQTNIGGTWAMLEACRRSPMVKSIVVASSDKAYGDHQARVCDEQTPLHGQHPYDVSKACADLIARTYAVSYSLPVAITRCGNFFGGGDLNWNRLIPGTIRSLHRLQRPVLRSNGQYTRDYFYVEDGTAAYLLLAERLRENQALRGEAFNFSYEAELTVLDLVERVRQIMGSNLTPEIRATADNEIPSQRLNAHKARSVLGWSPEFSVDDGLQRTIGWYTTFLNRVDRKDARV
jgi:CDP-glucose 4,6-dehydratase